MTLNPQPHITGVFSSANAFPVETSRPVSTNLRLLRLTAFKVAPFAMPAVRLKVTAIAVCISSSLIPDLIVGFLNYLEDGAAQWTEFPKHSPCSHQVIHALHGISCPDKRWSTSGGFLAVSVKESGLHVLVKHLTIEEMQCILDRPCS